MRIFLFFIVLICMCCTNKSILISEQHREQHDKKDCSVMNYSIDKDTKIFEIHRHLGMVAPGTRMFYTISSNDTTLLLLYYWQYNPISFDSVYSATLNHLNNLNLKHFINILELETKTIASRPFNTCEDGIDYSFISYEGNISCKVFYFDDNCSSINIKNRQYLIEQNESIITNVVPLEKRDIRNYRNYYNIK